MNTYCVKCRKDTENSDPKIEQKIIDYLCNQNVLFVECKRTRSKRFITLLSKMPLLNVLF